MTMPSYPKFRKGDCPECGHPVMLHPERVEYLCWPCSGLSPFVDGTDSFVFELLPNQQYDKITHRIETGTYRYPAANGTEIRVIECTRFYDGTTDFLVPEDDVRAVVPPMTAELIMNPEEMLRRWAWGLVYEFWREKPEGPTRLVGNIVLGHSIFLLRELGVVEIPRGATP